MAPLIRLSATIHLTVNAGPVTSGEVMDTDLNRLGRARRRLSRRTLKQPTLLARVV